MSEWARTTSGDMAFPKVGSGAAAVVTDPLTCAQINLADRLRLFLGEWLLDTGRGFAWRTIVGQKATSSSTFLAQQALRKYLLASPNVLRVDAVSLMLDGPRRHLSGSFTVTIASGQQLTGDFVPPPAAPAETVLIGGLGTSAYMLPFALAWRT